MNEMSSNESHVNQQTYAICITNGCHSTAANNNLNLIVSNNKTHSHSRGSLEDHGVDVGRISPSTSSNDSRKSRYSSASLDSGRGSDIKTSTQLHRVSVHSCESLGSTASHKEIYDHSSSSSSSIGSNNSNNSATNDNVDTNVGNTAFSPQNVSKDIISSLSIAEMVLHGISDKEILHCWLSKIHFEQYANHFTNAGYDMPTISRMTPEDLTAIGITKPNHRSFLKSEIQKLNIADGIPSFKPNSLLEWLKLLRLEEYCDILWKQGYDSIDHVTELAWEDLEEVGITKLGHQKKIMLAIKRIKTLNNSMNHSPIVETASSLTKYNNTNCCADVISRPSTINYQLPVQTQSQDVPIKMFAPTKLSPSPTTESPTATQLKTFQQLPPNNFMFLRPISQASYGGVCQSEPQPFLFNATRGRSLESLENNDLSIYPSCVARQQRLNLNIIPKPALFLDNDVDYSIEKDKSQGYNTDSEYFNGYNGANKSYYEIDGTATLHRPKGLIKAKPIAKIAAKTRHIEPNSLNATYCNEQNTNVNLNSLPFENKNVFACDINSQINYMNEDCGSNNYFHDDCSFQMYSSLKRKKVPPPPPKRVNSIRNNVNPTPYFSGSSIKSPNHISSQSDCYDDFQEQVFANCVKNLTTKFSINDSDENSENDFPPPPSPLLFGDCHKDSYNTVHRECNISSSSSTESMPFANDNIGTIKQRVNIDANRQINSISPTYSSTSDSSATSPSVPQVCGKGLSPDTLKNDEIKLSSKNQIQATNLQKKDFKDGANLKQFFHSDNIGPVMDPFDDIETMLVNLSNQLDSMLENENHKE